MAGKWCDGTTNVPKFRDSKAFCQGRASRASVVSAFATGTTGVIGNNNALTWTAKVGGSGARIRLIDPQANNAEAGIVITSEGVDVYLGTDGTGAINTTATQVIALITGNPQADAMLSVANTGASTGAGMVVAESVVLTGSTNPYPIWSDEARAWDRGSASKVSAPNDHGCCAPTGAAAT